MKVHGTNVKIPSALFALSEFGVSGVDFSDMTAIAIFGLTSCALIGDSVGTVTAFCGKTRLLQMYVVCQESNDTECVARQLATL